MEATRPDADPNAELERWLAELDGPAEMLARLVIHYGLYFGVESPEFRRVLDAALSAQDDITLDEFILLCSPCPEIIQ